MNKLLQEIVFWIHLPIVAAWFGLFIVPTSIWPGRVTFHFWYIVILLIVQFLWSAIVFKKKDIICPLTTWLQWLRGYDLTDEKNFSHSFIAELFKRLKVKISFKAVNYLLLGTLILATILYIVNLS